MSRLDAVLERTPGKGSAPAAAEATEAAPGVRKRRWIPMSELEFVGCHSCRMTLEEFRNYPEDGKKIEYYDSRAGLAWMVREAVRPDHEYPSALLARLVERISIARGSPIECGRSFTLQLLDREHGQVQAMQPDEMLFLHPGGLKRTRSEYFTIGDDRYPDVVLEVDHSTDVREGKLRLYEEWGFPELWVEVPRAYSLRRKPGLPSGLRIYVLEGDRYLEATESRAFPGWRAPEIHRALNEEVISEETWAVLDRVGRALGAREGTGPDDDPQLRAHRAEARAEGRAAGHAEGRAAERVATARALLERRGIPMPPDFPAGLTPAERKALDSGSLGQILEAAETADSLAQFLARLR